MLDKYLEIDDILEDILNNSFELKNIISKDSNLDKSEIDKLKEYNCKFIEFYTNNKSINSEMKRHKYSRISGWLIDKYKNASNGIDINDSINLVLDILEYIEENICENEEIKRKIEKVRDHLELEQKRLNYSQGVYMEICSIIYKLVSISEQAIDGIDAAKNQLKKTNELLEKSRMDKDNLLKSISDAKDEISKISDEYEKIKENVQNTSQRMINEINKANTKAFELDKSYDKIKEDMKKVDDELKTNKFDLIALTTLVFTAFTMVSLNVTVITGIISSKNTYTLSQIIVSILIVNMMLMSVVYLIYMIIGRIHGKIENKEFWKTLAIIIAIFTILLFLSINSKVLNIITITI